MQHPSSLLDLPEVFRHRRRRSIRRAVVAFAALFALAMIVSDVYGDGIIISRFIGMR
jgi:hypothetical protein